MSSVIKINSDSYNEIAAVEDRNWAAAYAKREIQRHKEAATLDHPDGSVTEAKLSAALREKITDGSEQTKKDIAELKTQAATAEENIKEVTNAIQTETAERTADTAELKTETERIAKEVKTLGTGILYDGSVTTAKLANKSVTAEKIADKAVSRNHFADDLERQAANWDVAYSSIDLLMSKFGSIDTALDSILAIQEQLINGVTV